MDDFKNLKKKSGKSLEDLTKRIEEENKRPVYNDIDETFWMPKLDKAGNGSGVIRLLPAPPMDGEDATPWVKYWRHSFQGPGGWYIENSLTSIQQPDPLAEVNAKLWATKVPDNVEQARKQKRKLTYVCGIEVISDPANPENNGKVFKWKFGQKIFAKFEEAMAGDPGDEVTPATPGFDPFDFWDGANFRLKVTKQGDYPNYDDSKFGPKTPHKNGNDKALEELWKTQYSLKAELSPDKFKTYEKLKERLDKVLMLDDNQPVSQEPKKATERKTAETTRVKKTVIATDDTPPWDAIPDASDDEITENLKFFQNLVDQD